MMLDKVEKSKEATSYIKEVPTDYVDPVEGKEYLFFVNSGEENWINSNAFGMLEKVDNQYLNVVTQEVINVDGLLK